MDKIERRWTAYANQHLIGRRIVSVRYMTQEEADGLDWYSRPLVIHLDNGTLLYMSSDDEGNDGGALFGNTEKEQLTFPVI